MVATMARSFSGLCFLVLFLRVWVSYGFDCRNFSRGEDGVIRFFKDIPKKDLVEFKEDEMLDYYYVSKITLHNFTFTPKVGINSFTINSTTALDFYYVRLAGPEFSYGIVQYTSDGNYLVEYCVESPGYYELFIDLQMVKNHTFNRYLFASPFSLLVEEEEGEKTPLLNTAVLPPCETMWDASYGRWKHADRLVDANRWESVFELTREPYVWLPYTCSLSPKSGEDVGEVFKDVNFCECGDSYLRTLTDELLLWGGIWSQTIVHEIERKHKIGSWSIKPVAFQHEPKCPKVFDKTCDVILTSFLEGIKNIKLLGGQNGEKSFRFHMPGHPWAADVVKEKRTNVQLWWSSQVDLPKLMSMGIDAFDVMHFAYSRLDKVCDGSHVACFGRLREVPENKQNHYPLGMWEALIFTNVFGNYRKKIGRLQHEELDTKGERENSVRDRESEIERERENFELEKMNIEEERENFERKRADRESEIERERENFELERMNIEEERENFERKRADRQRERDPESKIESEFEREREKIELERMNIEEDLKVRVNKQRQNGGENDGEKKKKRKRKKQ